MLATRDQARKGKVLIELNSINVKLNKKRFCKYVNEKSEKRVLGKMWVFSRSKHEKSLSSIRRSCCTQVSIFCLKSALASSVLKLPKSQNVKARTGRVKKIA